MPVTLRHNDGEPVLSGADEEIADLFCVLTLVLFVAKVEARVAHLLTRYSLAAGLASS